MADALGTLRRFLLLTGLYYAGAVLASLYLRTPDDVTLFWPSAGLGFAVAVTLGMRWAVIVPFALCVLHLTVLKVPDTFVPYSVASNTLATLAAGWYAHRERRADGLHLRTADGLMLLRGGILLGVVGAAIGTVGLVHAGMVDAGDAGRAYVTWALGDLLGVATLAPACTVLLSRGGLGQEGLWRDRVGRREQSVWGAGLVLSLVAIVSAGQSGNLYALGLVSLPLALLLWSAVRFAPLTTMVGTIFVVTFLSLLTGLGLGGFTRPLTLLDASVLMLLLILISVIPVMLAVATYEQAHTAAALFHRATRDPLTGLLNRSTFEERARERLAGDEHDLSLIYIDLDHFKLVNDSASHVAGDDMIRNVADLIAAEFGDEALVARTGGDEFAVLVPVTEASAIACGRRVLGAIDALRIQWQEQLLSAAASIGIAHSVTPHTEFDRLLSLADAACFAAKEYGGNRLIAASREGDELKLRTASMRSALQVREALDQRRFTLFCQPIVPLDPGVSQKRNFEILLRWTDPTTGAPRAPAELIAAAERYRLGPRLDRYVVDAVLQWLETHPEQAQEIHHCGINLGGGTLVDEEFSDYFAARLRRSNVPAERLCLEITETSVVRDRTRAQRFIARMRDLGCRFALDDFGTGFCSFGYLQHLDVDYLKIDGSFVRDLGRSDLADAVIRSITDIAHVLDKRTVAEQAETLSQLDHLRSMGVDYAQGYAISRPESIDSFFAQAARVRVDAAV